MRYNSIQYLRALAAGAVVLHHASGALFNDKGGLIPFSIGEIGVDVFFVISGFVMYYTTAKDNISPKSFYIRRILRIFPTYFIFTTIAFMIAVFLPHYTRTFSSNSFDYIRSILFIPYINDKAGHFMRPEITQGWTLNYEMFFYFVFGITLLKSAKVRLYCCIIIFSLLGFIGSLLQPENVLLATYTNSLTLEFVFGVVIAYFTVQKPKYLIILLKKMVFLSIVILLAAYFFKMPRFLMYGVPSAAIVSMAIILERRGLIPTIPWLLLIGDASYSLYLSHCFILAVLRRAFQSLTNIHLLVTNVVFMATSLLLATITACIFYKFIEFPITKALVNKSKKRNGVRDMTKPHTSETPIPSA